MELASALSLGASLGYFSTFLGALALFPSPPQHRNMRGILAISSVVVGVLSAGYARGLADLTTLLFGLLAFEAIRGCAIAWALYPRYRQL